jgi:hypothetical protein
MKKTIWTGTCSVIVGVATVVITAQTSSPPQSSTSSDRKVTVTGCLKAAPPTSADATAPAGTAGTAGTTGTAGTAGTAGAAAASGDTAGVGAKFLLTNATVSAADTGAAGSTAATSTAGAPSTSAATQTYRLMANPEALSPHVGKKVELTGTLVDQNSPASSASSDAAASPANAPALRVEAGKIVAPSCSE